MEIQRKVKHKGELNTHFWDEIRDMSGCQEIDSYIQSRTCSSSCPMSVYRRYPPRRIIAMIKNGFKDEALSSFAIWLCSSCYTCRLRCLTLIKITNVTFVLKRKAIE
jgi:heterodisulfide reductase subunit C